MHFLNPFIAKLGKFIVVTGWEPSSVTIDGKTTVKPEVEWTNAKDQTSFKISRALNAIYNGVNENVLKLIKICISTKEARKILRVSYEGTSKVKTSQLQMLSSRFESLRMMKEESIVEFNVRVLYIANKSFALGQKIFESKLVKKVLRYLPRHFDMKVTAIEEAHH